MSRLVVRLQRLEARLVPLLPTEEDKQRIAALQAGWAIYCRHRDNTAPVGTWLEEFQALREVPWPGYGHVGDAAARAGLTIPIETLGRYAEEVRSYMFDEELMLHAHLVANGEMRYEEVSDFLRWHCQMSGMTPEEGLQWYAEHVLERRREREQERESGRWPPEIIDRYDLVMKTIERWYAEIEESHEQAD